MPINYIDSLKGQRFRRCHARIQGLISSVASKLGYIMDIERELKTSKGARFRADVVLWDNKKLFSVIDYESPNSCDWRVDFERYKKYVLNPGEDGFPKYWIIITTLPKKQVSSWTSWDKLYRRMPKKTYHNVLKNPFKFYYKYYYKNLKRIKRKFFSECKLFVFNLTERGLQQTFPS